jgi:hypothetical protein
MRPRSAACAASSTPTPPAARSCSACAASPSSATAAPAPRDRQRVRCGRCRGRRGRAHRGAACARGGAAARARGESARDRNSRMTARRSLTWCASTSPRSSQSTTRRYREGTRFREDLDADSLDLYELVMELEDATASPSRGAGRPGSRPSADAVDFVVEHARWREACRVTLPELVDELPTDCAQALPTPPGRARIDSYERLAYPRRQRARARRRHRARDAFPGSTRGLTKIHNQASAASPAPRWPQLGAGDAARARAEGDRAIPGDPAGRRPGPARGDRGLIGACFLALRLRAHRGRGRRAFAARIEHAAETRSTSSRRCRSCSPGAGARKLRGDRRIGPAHERTFEVAAVVDCERVGTGRAEQEGGRAGAAEQALKRSAASGGRVRLAREPSRARDSRCI